MADPARETQRALVIADERGHPPRSFAFADWARESAFAYPPQAAGMLERAGSPAEAHFLRALSELEGVLFDGACAYYRGVMIRAQVDCDRFSIDAVAERSWVRLAIEIDGAHHRETPKQIADDYFRQRRLLYKGFVVVRFTAGEAMNNGRMCWRSVFEILKVQLRLPMERKSERDQRTGA